MSVPAPQSSPPRRLFVAFLVVPTALLVLALMFVGESAEATPSPTSPAHGLMLTPTPTSTVTPTSTPCPIPTTTPIRLDYLSPTGNLQAYVVVTNYGAVASRIVGPLGEYEGDGQGAIIVDLVADSSNAFQAFVDIDIPFCDNIAPYTQQQNFTIVHDSSIDAITPTPTSTPTMTPTSTPSINCPIPTPPPFIVNFASPTGALQVDVFVSIRRGESSRIVGELGEYTGDGNGPVTVDLIADTANRFLVSATVAEPLPPGDGCPDIGGYTMTRSIVIVHDSELDDPTPTPTLVYCPTATPEAIYVQYESPTGDLRTNINVRVTNGESTRIVRSDGLEYIGESGGDVLVDLIADSENRFEVFGKVRVIPGAPGCPDLGGYTLREVISIVHDSALAPQEFECSVDAGVLSWTDAQQEKYWLYKSTDGVNYSWLGKSLGDTEYYDPTPTFGATYQVHYQGIDREVCTTVAEPGNASTFSCRADAGVLRWPDAGQEKYWVYKSTDGVNYSWLGKSRGDTNFFDPAPTVGATYEVHYQGIARKRCAVVAEPGDVDRFACQNDQGDVVWSDGREEKYWVYRSTDGVNYTWLGKTLGASTINDPNWAPGTTYKVHFPGIARVLCSERS